MARVPLSSRSLVVAICCVVMSNVSGEPQVASADQILDAKAQLDGLLLEMKSRSAGGKAASGRYKKHDTARLSYINCVALPGLRWGKIPPAADWKMLFMPGDDHISGADRVNSSHDSNDSRRLPRSRAHTCACARVPCRARARARCVSPTQTCEHNRLHLRLALCARLHPAGRNGSLGRGALP